MEHRFAIFRYTETCTVLGYSHLDLMTELIRTRGLAGVAKFTESALQTAELETSQVLRGLATPTSQAL